MIIIYEERKYFLYPSSKNSVFKSLQTLETYATFAGAAAEAEADTSICLKQNGTDIRISPL